MAGKNIRSACRVPPQRCGSFSNPVPDKGAGEFVDAAIKTLRSRPECSGRLLTTIKFPMRPRELGPFMNSLSTGITRYDSTHHPSNHENGFHSKSPSGSILKLPGRGCCRDAARPTGTQKNTRQEIECVCNHFIPLTAGPKRTARVSIHWKNGPDWVSIIRLCRDFGGPPGIRIIFPFWARPS